METFNAMLTGGHPNSLGRTVEVVDLILADAALLEQLYQCYFDSDEVVRLRTSNAMKRICKEHPEWLVPYLDRFLNDISQINQASTQWTLAQLFLELESFLTTEQRARAIAVMQHNLTQSNDWIVLNQTLQTLAAWAKDDLELNGWLKPQLERLQTDPRKSVANTALKLYTKLYSPPKPKPKRTKS